MEPRRAHRGVETEDDSDRDRNADRDDHGAARDEERNARRLRDLVDDQSDRPPEQDADHPTESGECDRLDEELVQDVATPRADGLADPDLTGPLIHRHQHDVYDPDAAEEQRDQTGGARGQCYSDDDVEDDWSR